jgi:pyridoxine 4-dehydrogenase
MGSIGLSNATVDEVTAALETVDLGEVQNAYNIMLRDDEDVLRFCADRDIAYVPFFPIGSPSTAGPRPLARDATISGVAAKVADAVVFLAEQGPRAATHELQVTPLAETWVP